MYIIGKAKPQLWQSVTEQRDKHLGFARECHCQILYKCQLWQLFINEHFF